jgi:hypothetical protein
VYQRFKTRVLAFVAKVPQARSRHQYLPATSPGCGHEPEVRIAAAGKKIDTSTTVDPMVLSPPPESTWN